MIQLSNSLAQRIIEYCNNDSADWVIGLTRRLPKDNKINRGRKQAFIQNTPLYDEILDVVSSIEEQIGSDIEYRSANPDDKLYHLISSMFPTGTNKKSLGVQRHTDSRDHNDWLHVRINFMIQKPKDGGEPIINSRLVPVKQGQSWNCWASEYMHSALPVEDTDDVSRIMLSLCFYVAESSVPEFKRRLEKIVDVPCN